MELRDLASHGEPGAVVYLADCVELMRLMPASCVDAVFADPPYRLSTGRGVTVKSGRLAPVDKGHGTARSGTGRNRHATHPLDDGHHAGNGLRARARGLMEARGIPAEPEEMKALAERGGFDLERFMGRLTEEPQADLGPLNGLLWELRLSKRERKDLAMAYVFERDPAPGG